MRVSVTAILVAVATGLAALLAGCENVTMSTAQARSGPIGLRDAVAADANTDFTRDAILAERLTESLRSDPTIAGAKIYVSVSDGRARLSGFVDSAAAKLRAGVLASGTNGVDDVDNRLILRHRADMSQDPIGDARVHL